MRKRLNTYGYHDFIPNFGENFKGVVETLDRQNRSSLQAEDDIPLSGIKINIDADEKKEGEDKAATFIKSMVGLKRKARQH